MHRMKNRTLTRITKQIAAEVRRTAKLGAASEKVNP